MSTTTPEKIREQILSALVDVRNKNDNSVIEIKNRELRFESSQYSSTKENIWHVFINGTKIKKTSDFIFGYRCLHCDSYNSCASTQFLRKIRQAKCQCFQCNTINLNTIDYPAKQKIEKVRQTHHEHYENSKLEFENYPDQYKNSYLLSHLSQEDYIRIKSNILSFGNGKYVDIENYEYWPIYKVNNQMKFSYVIYDTIHEQIFKANQPVLKCDNCEKTWRAKSLEIFKNCYKILCPDCKFCNRTFKLRPTKNINHQIIMYQSKLELKFIEWCASMNIVVNNGPGIEYNFNEKVRKYRLDFQIDNLLIEIKDFHIWHKNKVQSGMWEKKVDAVNKYIQETGLKKYYFITPNNWKQMLKEITNEMDKINN
jgi:hypothetical protein